MDQAMSERAIKAAARSLYQDTRTTTARSMEWDFITQFVRDGWIAATTEALAAAQRVAGEDGLKAEIKQLMDDNGYTANELGKAQAEIKRLRAALALSPGKVSEEC